MAIPLPPNTQCDIYRNASDPPNPPDEQGIPCHLTANYYRALESGESRGVTDRYDYVMLVSATTDVRDGYNLSSVAQADKVFVPDQNGTKFWVRFVERRGRGSPHDHKRVYLCRDAVNWPTTEGL